jgi:hypothetical protein
MAGWLADWLLLRGGYTLYGVEQGTATPPRHRWRDASAVASHGDVVMGVTIEERLFPRPESRFGTNSRLFGGLAQSPDILEFGSRSVYCQLFCMEPGM